jgi:hypothetical protein
MKVVEGYTEGLERWRGQTTWCHGCRDGEASRWEIARPRGKSHLNWWEPKLSAPSRSSGFGAEVQPRRWRGTVAAAGSLIHNSLVMVEVGPGCGSLRAGEGKGERRLQLWPIYGRPRSVRGWPQRISEKRAMVAHLRYARRRKRRDPTTRAHPQWQVTACLQMSGRCPGWPTSQWKKVTRARGETVWGPQVSAPIWSWPHGGETG